MKVLIYIRKVLFLFLCGVLVFLLRLRSGAAASAGYDQASLVGLQFDR